MYATVPRALPGLVNASRAVNVGAPSDVRAGSHFRQPEIENLRVPAIRDEEVRGLDVAMDDPCGVCGLQRVGDLDRKQQQHVDVDRAASDSMLQRHALEELHDDEGVAVLLADVVNRADVGMVQRGRGPRFSPEAHQRVRIGREFR